MGSPIAPVGQYGTPGDKLGVWQQKNGLIFYFWPRLFDITHDESHCGKRVGFRGIYCCLGGPIGAPMVPDGQYGTPGDRWGGWEKRNWFDFGF